jgi:hypothetical protein
LPAIVHCPSSGGDAAAGALVCGAPTVALGSAAPHNNPIASNKERDAAPRGGGFRSAEGLSSASNLFRQSHYRTGAGAVEEPMFALARDAIAPAGSASLPMYLLNSSR